MQFHSPRAATHDHHTMVGPVLNHFIEKNERQSGKNRFHRSRSTGRMEGPPQHGAVARCGRAATAFCSNGLPR
jgi:hypothetical protein